LLVTECDGLAGGMPVPAVVTSLPGRLAVAPPLLLAPSWGHGG
jgi:hypothetical protein